MLLVGGESVPDNEFPILSTGHQVPLVRAPVQTHNLGVVTLQTLAYLDVELVEVKISTNHEENVDPFLLSTNQEQVYHSCEYQPIRSKYVFTWSMLGTLAMSAT